jgi:hypothetical protein
MEGGGFFVWSSNVSVDGWLLTGDLLVVKSSMSIDGNASFLSVKKIKSSNKFSKILMGDFRFSS